jgi:hypothetical protein
MKTLLVSKKHHWGNTHYYPECEDSHTFAKLAGDLTLTAGTRKLIKSLGYTFKLKPQNGEDL